MTKIIAGLFERRRVPAAVLAHAFLILIVTACAGGPTDSSPTPMAQQPAPSATAPNPPTATPVPTQVPEPSPSATEAPPTEPTQERVSRAAHTVEAGDTLLGLAREYDVPMAAIQLQNQMGDSTVVKIGQILSIPPAEEWEGSSAFWTLHEVSAGETLIAIARVYDVEPDRLQAVNGLDDADRLAVGQNLVLPLSGPAGPRAPGVAASVPTSAPVPAPVVTAADTSETTENAEDTPAPSESPEATEVPQAPAPPSSPPADLADWPREIARLINEVRAQHGLPPLTYDLTLEQSAQAHANDCSQRGWCSHTGSDGANIKTRVRRAGYTGRGWAECWAQTQSPRRAVEVWMDETPPNDPHRRTLLSTWFSEIGIGVSDATWGTYIIANFGRP